jgi:prolyl 4-hydroxylase
MERQIITPAIFTVTDVLTGDECQEMIALAHARGFEAATISTWNGPRIDREARNNDRVILEDFDLAQRLWRRVESYVSRVRLARQVCGLNERFRFYRYAPDQRFSWHADAPFARDNGELSLLTFMIYLNDNYQGGETRFQSLSVHGKSGMALVFEHGLLHEGAAVTEGTKYVLRSDIMFGPVGRFSG